MATEWLPTSLSGRRQALAALILFVLAQGVGLFLRLLPLNPLPVNATNVLYGHTHVALSGWVQAVLYLILLSLLPEASRNRPVYRRLWWFAQGSVVGMLIAFPLQGYKVFSIVFSTLGILVSYVLIWLIWQDSRELKSPAWQAARWGCGFLLLSSLGPWSLGILMTRLPGSIWINLAVYFYLHFLYNGFFSFVLLALLLHWLLPEADVRVQNSMHLLALACVPGYALSALWVHPPAWVWGLAWIAAMAQLVAMAGLLPPLLRAWHQQSFYSPWIKALLGVSLFSLGCKWSLQALSALPVLAETLVSHRLLIIAYLHLVFLGFVTPLLLAWLFEQRLLRISVNGLRCLLAGILLSEICLFGQGAWTWFWQTTLPGFYLGLFLASALIPLGSLLLLWQQGPEQATAAVKPVGHHFAHNEH